MTLTAGVSYSYDGDGRRVQKSNGKLYWYGMSSSTRILSTRTLTPNGEKATSRKKRMPRLEPLS